MPQTPSHRSRVERQFGARASAYLASAVHARGIGLEELEALAKHRPQARVLDLGCGGGHASFRMAPHAAEVVAYDLSAEMLATVAKAARDHGLDNLSTECGTVEHLPFADGHFDIVMSRLSAHHWTDLDAGLREAARVLKPGGTAAMIDAVSPADALCDTWLQTIELLRDPSHVRDYTPGEWQAALARAGLVPVAMRSFRVRLDFATWIERMQTPKVQADAIRALHAQMSDTVARHFALEADGSFTIDIAMFEALKPAGPRQ